MLREIFLADGLRALVGLTLVDLRKTPVRKSILSG